MDSISLYEKRDELKRVLQSKRFAKAKKKSRILEFVCEQMFLGNAEKLNEYLIGVEVYERGADFDAQQDPIVRVQAHEIRRSLKEYYDDEGKKSPWRIELPAGHYVPVFSRSEAHENLGDAGIPAAAFPWQLILRRDALVALLAAACLILGALLLRERARPSASAPVQAAESTLPESMLWFWRPFLPPSRPPLIVIPNHPLLRAAHDGDTRETLARSHLVPKEKLPEFRDTIHFRELRGFYFVPTTTDFTGVGETLGLLSFFELFSQAAQSFRVKACRLVDFNEIKDGNSILLGGNQPWSGKIFLYPEGFWFHNGIIWNKNPRKGEKSVYKPEFDQFTNNLMRDYALVMMLPNENKEQRILLVYGIYTQGSQAAIEYITNPERLGELYRALLEFSPDRKAPPPYFQVLLETTVENNVPGKALFVAARTIPK